jgi:Domain of unknown function (DUF6484)
MSAIELELEQAIAELEPAQDQPRGKRLEVPIAGAVVGVLIGFKNNGTTPLVMFIGQPGTAACAARSTVDLQGTHIGRQILLVFEQGDPHRPIVVGLLHQSEGWSLADQPGQVEVEADGERLIIGAKQQLVLKCGKASITLTKDGKVLIQGAYVSSRSSGVNRIKGGSVQLN